MRRRRTSCAFCGARRMCWPMVRHVRLGQRVTRSTVTIPTCDECLFELRCEGAFDAD